MFIERMMETLEDRKHGKTDFSRRANLVCRAMAGGTGGYWLAERILPEGNSVPGKIIEFVAVNASGYIGATSVLLGGATISATRQILAESREAALQSEQAIINSLADRDTWEVIVPESSEGP